MDAFLASYLSVQFFFFKYKFIYFNWRLITLQYCIGFVQLFYNLDHILIQKKIF